MDSDRPIKCVVWDLDGTLWRGVLAEGDAVALRQEPLRVIRELDGRGILHSVASKNDADTAMAVLQAHGLADLFLHPQINWGPKSASVAAIARALNIGTDTLALVDDQAFERQEVRFAHPEVLCLDAERCGELRGSPRARGSAELASRRLLYLADMQRQKEEQRFEGTSEEFLATLEMALTIHRATEDDLARADELTRRTSQLNTTGYTYSPRQLKDLLRSEDHLVLMARLRDRLGDMGKIGLAVVETDSREAWTLKLLLISCRVMSRGVGNVLLSRIMGAAARHGVALRAELIPTGRNRMMYATYKFAGFAEVSRKEGLVVLQSDCARWPGTPDYMTVDSWDGPGG